MTKLTGEAISPGLPPDAPAMGQRELKLIRGTIVIKYLINFHHIFYFKLSRTF